MHAELMLRANVGIAPHEQAFAECWESLHERIGLISRFLRAYERVPVVRRSPLE